MSELKFNTSGCFCFLLICCGSPCFPSCISEKGRDGMIIHLLNCREWLYHQSCVGLTLVWCPVLPCHAPRHPARAVSTLPPAIAIVRSPAYLRLQERPALYVAYFLLYVRNGCRAQLVLLLEVGPISPNTDCSGTDEGKLRLAATPNNAVFL